MEGGERVKMGDGRGREVKKKKMDREWRKREGKARKEGS